MAGYMPARADFMEVRTRVLWWTILWSLSPNHTFLFTQQEFDNYAEWDLKDIDFVDDDSDILRGEAFFNLRFFSIERESIMNNGLWNFLFCFSTQAVRRGYIPLKIKGETEEEKVGLPIYWDAVTL